MCKKYTKSRYVTAIVFKLVVIIASEFIENGNKISIGGGNYAVILTHSKLEKGYFRQLCS